MNEIFKDQLQYYGKIWLNRVSLVFAIILILPTTAILATWNTLPNEPLYPIKRSLENVALILVGNSFSARADLQAQFVEQRFNEAETLITQSSNEGILGLTQQIQVAKTEIIAAKNSKNVKEVEVAQKKSEKLVTQLKGYDKQLENVKTQISTTPSPTVAPSILPSKTPVPTIIPTSTPIKSLEPTLAPSHLPSATASPSPSNKVAVANVYVEQVSSVQSQIQSAITELSTVNNDNNQNNQNNSDNNSSKNEKKDKERGNK
jgi:hypothetical protein